MLMFLALRQTAGAETLRRCGYFAQALIDAATLWGRNLQGFSGFQPRLHVFLKPSVAVDISLRP
jgi:hypothetical protein